MLYIGAAFALLAVIILWYFGVFKRQKASSEGDNPEGGVDLSRKLIQAKGALSETMLNRLNDYGIQQVPEAIELWPRIAPEIKKELVDFWESQGFIKDYLSDLGTKDEGKRAEAARILISLKEKRIIPLLVDALSQPEKYLPARVAEVLAAFGTDTVDYLSGMLFDLPDKTKSLAIDILQEIADDRAVVPLIKELAAESPEIRQKAVSALGEIGNPKALENLINLMGDVEWKVRSMTARALGQLGCPEAIPVLQKALNDEAWWVRVNARDALDKLVVNEKKHA
ncbi:MAG: HEAT repeat domain-containing protein [Desulfitobacteriaceae bacterium]|nr:HEAT repeat domain-containing protein [Desulfitobacteriaceae bacterium]MDD4751701.1 HEAT repeat domain-containing protein [Desulfitobacteriaceae bacterium]